MESDDDAAGEADNLPVVQNAIPAEVMTRMVAKFDSAAMQRSARGAVEDASHAELVDLGQVFVHVGHNGVLRHHHVPFPGELMFHTVPGSNDLVVLNGRQCFLNVPFGVFRGLKAAVARYNHFVLCGNCYVLLFERDMDSVNDRVLDRATREESFITLKRLVLPLDASRAAVFRAGADELVLWFSIGP